MLGLTLEGGASRTVYSCGIMDALLEDKIIADYVIGVSAGAAFGVSYCSGQIGRNLRLATEFMGKSIARRRTSMKKAHPGGCALKGLWAEAA